MDRLLTRVKYVFLALFAAGVVGIWTYQVLYAIPQARCERNGGWWAAQWRICGTPVRLSHFTGRPDRVPAPPGTPGV